VIIIEKEEVEAVEFSSHHNADCSDNSRCTITQIYNTFVNKRGVL
jgi:hypothetical protein